MGMERRDQGHEIVRGRSHDYVDWCLLIGGQRWGERQSGFLSEAKVAEFSIVQNRKPRRGTDLGKTTNLLLERLSLRCRRWLYPSVHHPRDLPTGLPECPHDAAANFPPSGQCASQAEATVSFTTKLQNRTLSFQVYPISYTGQPYSVWEVTTQRHESPEGTDHACNSNSRNLPNKANGILNILTSTSLGHWHSREALFNKAPRLETKITSSRAQL